MAERLEQEICDKMNELYCSENKDEVGILEMILQDIDFDFEQEEEEE